MNDADAYSEFMNKALKLWQAPMPDNPSCATCHDTGLVPETCCGGFECGCMGLPVDFKTCDCGAEVKL